MFKSNINGSFKEEFVEINKFVKSVINKFAKKRLRNKLFWTILAFILAITNITILILSSLALNTILSKHIIGKSNLDSILPTALVAGLSIFMFFLSITISIYQGVMKSQLYLDASKDIQFLTIAYSQNELKITEKEFIRKIKKISKNALDTKKKISLKKTVISILTGGNDE